MVNRVTGTGAGAFLAGRPKATAASAPPTGFSVAGDGPASIQENQPAQSVMLSGMLALQEAETGAAQDKAARRHGFALLEALSELQKALLSGLGDANTAAASLGRLTAEMPEPSDPALATLLDSIRIRAKIELLRQGVEIA